MKPSGDRAIHQKSSAWRLLADRVITSRRSMAIPADSTILTGLLLMCVFVLFMGLVQFSTPDMPDNDGYYHIKMAALMRTEGLKPAFPWLPLTVLNPREFHDHHFLFHVLLIPFTFGDLRLGAKWAAVIFSSLAFLSVWRLLDRQRIPYAALWSLGLLAVSEAFIYRMSIARAQSLSLALLVIGVNWLLARKYSRLFILGFVFAWFYNAFPLLLSVAGLFVLAVWLTERRLELRPLVYGGSGIIAGLMINPYFPYNVVFALQHILPKLLEPTSLSVGNEWYPYDTGQLLANSPLGLVAFISGALALGLSGRRMDLRTATGFFLACLFGLMLFQSRRFIEYFPAFALIFAAFAWAPLIASPFAKVQPDEKPSKTLLVDRVKRWLPALAAAIFLIPAIWSNFEASKSSLQGSKPYGLYSGATAWLEAHTPAGARVFQTDWDDFPRLFFYNTHNTYLVGLDPTYLQLYDANLYNEWVVITQGKVKNPSNAIAADFGAHYVLTDLYHESFLSRAANDPQLVEVYRDTDAVIFHVIGP